ncbi:MAG: FKBP-type peptidyl-prolyl cis-trans isomerase [Marmoricola sp.]
MKRPTLAGPALLLALAMPLAACGSGNGDNSASGSHPDVTVKGAVGSTPQLKVHAPLHLKKSTSYVAVKGHGDPVQKGKLYVLQLTLADGHTGKTVISTYSKGQRPLTGTAGQGGVPPVLDNALVGKKAGSRVVVEATDKDAFGGKGNSQLGIKPKDPVVMVADIVATAPEHALTGPKGTSVKPPKSAPKLLTKKGVPTGFDFGSLPKPKHLEVIPLVKGHGPKVPRSGTVTVNYLGSVWGSHKAFDQSYTKHQTATFPVGMGSVIPGWDKGLVGVPQGSRVLLLCPPQDAYGPQGQPPSIPKNATLAFVVDVLGVS